MTKSPDRCARCKEFTKTIISSFDDNRYCEECYSKAMLVHLTTKYLNRNKLKQTGLNKNKQDEKDS